MAQRPRTISPTEAEEGDGVIRAHARLLGERINTLGFEDEAVISATPLGLKVGPDGLALIFRYGAVVMIGLSPDQEAAFLRRLEGRISGPFDPSEDETLLIRVRPDEDEAVTPQGLIQLREGSAERFSVIADVLAKSVALARAEREVADVYDQVEPLTRSLTVTGAPPASRRSFLQVMGSALTVQHRVSGRVAVREKPDILWERPDLERLYGRLEDEFELVERAEALDRNLQVVGATATAMIDLQDTARSQRLELMVVVLILIEIVLSLLQLYIDLRR